MLFGIYICTYMSVECSEDLQQSSQHDGGTLQKQTPETKKTRVCHGSSAVHPWWGMGEMWGGHLG